jgi:ABC-type branched-subunit amino acid transport system substrate-binding protein
MTPGSVKLAMEEINTAGGIPKNSIRFSERDKRDEGDPLINDVAVQSTDALISSGVDVIVGPVTSAAAERVIDKVTCAGMIMFSPANSSTSFTTYSDHGLYFRTAATSEVEGEALGQLVIDDGNSTVVVMSRDDPWGNSLREVVEKVITRSGRKVVDSFSFDPKARDFNSDVPASQG